MKKTLLFVAMMLCCAMTMFAQNDKISYQAVVRDTENKLVANKSVEVTVNIYNGTATTAAYTETQTVTTNLNGLISLQIGPNGTNANWNSIEWNQARIETTVKLNGTQLGTLAMPLTAVPYAMYAKYADNVDPDALAAQMHDTANNVRNEVNTQVNNLETEIANLSNSVDTAKANIRGEIGNAVNSLETNINNLASSVDTAKANIRGEVGNAVSSLDTKIDNLASSVDSAKANIRGEIGNSADSLNTKISNLANSVDSAKTNIRGEIGNSADSLNTKISNLANSVDSAKANIRGEIGNSADSLNTKISNLANSVDSAKTNIRGEISNTANNLETEITNLSSSVDTAKTNIRNEIAALSQDVATNYVTNTTAQQIALQIAQQLTNTLNTLNARIDSVINVMNNLPTRMVEQRDTVQTAGQTSFTLAHEARADCVVRMYINGVMVGGNYNDVVTVSNTTVTYDPTKNGNYALKADDKVTIVYWY
jgi:uncharacterized coiled-coil DUF342 family protein